METARPDLYTNTAGAKDTESFLPLSCRCRKSSIAKAYKAFHLISELILETVSFVLMKR